MAETVSPVEALQALQNDGGERFDPTRFHYLWALAQRTQAAPEAVQRLLNDRLREGVADFASRFQQARQTSAEALEPLCARHPAQARELRRLFAAGDFAGLRQLAARAAAAPSGTVLAALPEHIQRRRRENVPAVDGPAALFSSPRADAPEASGRGVELASAQRFRETWQRLSAAEQLNQAVGRGPENAGPLNSHMLVLRSLEMMRSLSPDYLRRFLSQLDSLLWLERAGQKYKAPSARGKPATKSPRAGRSRP